ncbi:MAG: peptide transporter [Desulfurococcus sp.]|nr:peptide transporter [Desulfurococcus sp.]
MNRRVIIGVVMLVASIALNLWLTLRSSYEIPFDNTSWLTRFLLESRELSEACTALNALDNTCSSFIVYEWITARILWFLGSYGVAVISSLTIIALFILVNTLLENHVAAGLASLLYATAPAVVFWVSPLNTGYQVFTGLLVALILLAFYKATSRGSMTSIVFVGLLSLLLQLLNPMGWLIVEVMLAGLAAGFVGGLRRSLGEHIAVSIAVSSIIPAALPLLRNYYSLTPVLTSLLLIIAWRILSEEKAARGLRLITVLLVFTASISLTLLLYSVSGYIGYTDIYSKHYNQYLDYGVLPAAGLMGFILLTAAGSLRIPLSSRVAVASGSVVLLVAPLYDPTLTTAGSVFLAVSSTLFLVYLAEHFWSLKSTLQALYRIAVITLILSILAGSTLHTLALKDSQPAVYSLDLQGVKNLLGSTASIVRGESPWIKALSDLKSVLANTSESRILVLSYWGYTYWILGALAGGNLEVLSLSSSLGGDTGRYLLSSIMLSSEATAAKVINNITSRVNASEAYIVISYLASVKTTGPVGSRAVYLGVAYPVQTQGYYEYTFYIPAGDLARLILYSSAAGLNYTDYVNPANARIGYEVPLAWNTNGYNTLLVQLAVDSLRRLNYTVYNELYGTMPLESRLILFKPVVISESPVLSVNALFSSYQVIHVVAVYKLGEGA